MKHETKRRRTPPAGCPRNLRPSMILKQLSAARTFISWVLTIDYYVKTYFDFWSFDLTQTNLQKIWINVISNKNISMSNFRSAKPKCSTFQLGLLYFLCRSELSLYNVYQVFYFEQTIGLPKVRYYYFCHSTLA